MKNKVVKEIKSWAVSLIITIIIVIVLNMFVLKTARVSGSSMQNTLQDGDFGITWVFKAKQNMIKRFDIVVIDEKNEGLWIKRAVGLPNDTVEYKEGKLFINDKEIPETFLSEPYLGTVEKIQLKEDEYFVMGDNRNHSKDSRIIGPVKKARVLSADFIVLYPFNRFGVK